MTTRRTQVAALPWRFNGEDIEILLVTSRISKNWLLPKGWPMKRMTHAEAAATEAREEAGAVGSVAEKPFGTYRYDKLREGKSAIPCKVEVYPMRVEELVDGYREADQREKQWFSAEIAAMMVYEPDLARFIRDFAKTYGPIPEDASTGPRR